MASTTGEATEVKVCVIGGEKFKQDDIVYFVHISDVTGIKTGIVDFDGDTVWVMSDLDRFYLLKNCAFVSKYLPEINRQIMRYLKEQALVLAKNVEAKYSTNPDIDKRKQLIESINAKKIGNSSIFSVLNVREFERVHAELTCIHGQLIVEDVSPDND